MNLKFKLSLLVLLLWAMPRLSAQCLLPLDISMDSTVNLLWEQYLERGDFKYEETNKRSFERDKKAADNARLDSLFRVSRQYMVEQLGEAVFCKRVDMELFGAFSSIPSQFMVQYRFYYDKVSKDSHYHTFQFIFRLEESRYYDRMVCLPNLPNCRENPSFCQFKITHPDQAIQIAQEAGWIERHEIENMGVNDNWEWEMENVVNDHCGTNKIFVDMRTGERRLSEDEAWSALDGIAERVKSSPIVIEGVVLEEGDGYFSGSQPWISRIVEVNRIFKGDIGHGVIEVFGSGVRTTHGGLDLPPKGGMFRKVCQKF